MISFRHLALYALGLLGLQSGPALAQVPDTSFATFNFATWNPWAFRAPLRLIAEPARSQAPRLDLPIWNAAPAHLRLKDLEGKVVVLDFWNRACPPCLPLHLALNRLAPRWRAQGVEIVSILSDDPPAGLGAFLAEHGGPPPFPIVVDQSGTALNSFGSYGYPTVVLIDTYGRIALERLPGSARLPELEHYFPSLLAALERH